MGLKSRSFRFRNRCSNYSYEITGIFQEMTKYGEKQVFIRMKKGEIFQNMASFEQKITSQEYPGKIAVSQTSV